MLKDISLTFWALLLLSTASATTYYSQQSGAPNDLSNWNTSRTGGGSTPSNFSTSNDVFAIQVGHTMTAELVSPSPTGRWLLTGINMTLQVEDGGTLQANDIVDLTPSSTFQIDNGGRYNHNYAGNEIFDGTESFATSSTVELQELPGTTLDQGITFGNLIVNFSSGGSLRVDNSDNETFVVAGDLTIINTGGSSNEFRLASGSGDNVTLQIGGDFSLQGGRLDFYGSSGGTAGVIQVGGNFSFTNGVWDNAGGDNLEIVFTGGANSDVTFQLTNDVTIVGNAIDDCDWTIASGKVVGLLSDLEVGAGETCTVEGQLNCGTFKVADGGLSSTFTLSSTGALGIGAADGIENSGSQGNVQTDTRNYSPAATYVYNGTIQQTTGRGLYDETNELTGTVQISNTAAIVSPTEDVSFGDGFSLIVDESCQFDLESSLHFVKASGSTASITGNGSFLIEHAEGFSASSTSGGEALQGFTSCTFGSTGNVTYQAAGNQSITNQFTYGDLTLSASFVTSNVNNKTALGTLDIDGNLSIEGTADFDPDDHQINLSGNWTAAVGTDFSEGTGTIVFDGEDAQNIDTDGTETFYNISQTGIGFTSANDGINLAIGGTLNISAGTLNMGGNTLQTTSTNRSLIMSGGTLLLAEENATNQPNFGTVTISGGTIELSGAGDLELNGGETYENLTFSGSGIKTISSTTANINGTVYITDECILDVENRTFGNGSTDLTMDGGYFKMDGSGVKPSIGGTYTLTEGAIEFGGSDLLTIRSPKTYFCVLITGSQVSSSAGNYTLADGGSWVIANGATWSTTVRRILTAGIASVTVNGTFNTADVDGFSGGTATSIDQSISSITLGSASTIAYTSNSPQVITGRDDYVNLEVSGSGDKTFANTPEVSGRLSITSSGTVTLPSSITFDGTSSQDIPSLDYGSTNIIIDGGGDKVLQGNTTMNGTLTFTNGNLDIGTHTLTLGGSAVVSSANAASYIETSGSGRVSRSISSGSSFLFPVGHNPYLPMTISCSTCSGEIFEVGVQDEIYTDPEPGDRTTTFSDASILNFVDKTWEITAPALTDNITFNVQWNSSDQTVDPGSGNTSNDMGLGYWLTGTGAWTPGSIMAASVSGNQYSLSRTLSSTSAAIYYMGVGSSSTPLPVDLVDFTVSCELNNPMVRWHTSTEINNSHFTLQGSSDGSTYNTIERVEGAGTTVETQYYELRNVQPYTYYRLQQTDFDGTVAYSNVVINTCRPANSVLLKEGGILVQTNESQPYEIFTAQGTLASKGMLLSGNHHVDLKHLAKGIYILRSPDFTYRFVVQ